MLTEKMADVMVLMPMALSTMVTQYALYFLSDLRPFRPDFLANSYIPHQNNIGTSIPEVDELSMALERDQLHLQQSLVRPEVNFVIRFLNYWLCLVEPHMTRCACSYSW